jgi:hypothetical protein
VKKTSILLLVAVVAMLVVALTPGVAMANFAVHGNYVMDTNACAGCHRAHTAVSSITWSNGDNVAKSALLISTATETYQLCYVCHDSSSQGADTDVQTGVYDGTLYGTQGATLNGGGFESVNGVAVPIGSGHIMTGVEWAAYGGGQYGVPAGSALATGNPGPGFDSGVGNRIKMGCDTCHDVHGSSNYRILKDMVNGNAVGGYTGSDANPDPTPFVVSAEVGYPVGGFRLHLPYGAYIPSYTTPQYAKAPGLDPAKGMSGWCAGCHTTYLTQASTYNANDGYGLTMRHRHPMNVPLSNFKPVSRSLVVTDLALPLDHDVSEAGAIVNRSSDWIECLTCHQAHGSSVVMTGFADVANVLDPVQNSGGGGVQPTGHNALLRLNNRGVCEACHNK